MRASRARVARPRAARRGARVDDCARHIATPASMATRARGFPPAARPDVVRAAQKDETYAAVRPSAATRRATRERRARRDDATTR